MPRGRLRAVFAALALIIGVLLAGASPSTATGSPAPFQIPLDLHDGMVADFGGTYYAYGTEYGCGFNWGISGTPWCGFGVSTAPSLSGPWSTPVLLFPPSATDPWSNQTWQTECGGTGSGCFNARMIQRTGWGANDGVFILWFSSPQDWNSTRANAYNAMGCNGPAGPCGPTAGAPHGSYTKPSLNYCGGNGDFGVVQSATAGQAPALICTQPGSASLSMEQLNYWGVGGGGTGANNIAGLSSIEGPGGYFDTGSGRYVVTFSDPNCGYCAGAATGYATGTSLLGPYTAPANVAAASPPVAGRRDIDATSCGGQPRTVSVVDGQPWQGIDLWTGSRNETSAGVLYEPLQYLNPTGSAGDGLPWQPFTPWTC